MNAQPHPDQPTHRQAAEHGAVDMQRIEQRNYVAAQVFQREACVADSGTAMAPYVVAQHTKTPSQCSGLRLPRRVVRAKRVRKYDNGRVRRPMQAN